MKEIKTGIIMESVYLDNIVYCCCRQQYFCHNIEQTRMDFHNISRVNDSKQMFGVCEKTLES